MKLKLKLFLSIFPVSAGILLGAFLLQKQGKGTSAREGSDAAFSQAMAGLTELSTRSEESLRLAVSLIAQEAVWSSISPGTEKELVPLALGGYQKKAALELLFFVNSSGQLTHGAWSGDRWTLDELAQASRGFFRDGELRRKSGFLVLQGRVYHTALAPLALNGGSGYIGIASLFPFASFLRGTLGMESAVSGGDGKWSGGSFAVSPEETLRLNNVSADETVQLSLGGSPFLARAVRLDPELPSLRLVLLSPSGPPAESPGSGGLFLLLALGLAAASAAIAWLVSNSISGPLALIARAAREMCSSGAPVSTPASIAERKDEIGGVAASFNLLSRTLGDELRQKEKALGKLEKYQNQLLDLNHRLAKKLFENRVMLMLWKEQEKAEDTKDFLSHILEELLQGLPFHYGCIIIRPLAQIGPEVILARVERQRAGNQEISITDILERSDRTLWLSSLSPELKEFLLRMNQETMQHLRLFQEGLTASIEPESPVRNLCVVSLRLAQGNQHMGSLHLITERERFSLNASDEEFLLSLAAQVSVALENRSLQYATRLDPLTRLYNRGYMNDRLREEMLRTSRTQRSFTLMLLDIDHFKKVNDTYGHPAGDEVLVGLSALLKRSCRASDAICRYGGEEIAIILVDTPLTGAKSFAENIRRTIEAESFSIPDGKTLRITASMGLAEFPSQAGSMSELLKHADEALYKAKREGRNLWRAFSA